MRYYFDNKFLKIAKRWGLSAPSPFNLRFWWLEVAWFAQIVVFQTDYDEIKLQQNQLRYHFSDVIVITSPKNVTKLTSQDFSILGPFQSVLTTPVVANRFNAV